MPFTKKVTRYTSDGKVIELRSRQYSEVWIDIVDSGIGQPFESLVIILILAYEFMESDMVRGFIYGKTFSLIDNHRN